MIFQSMIKGVVVEGNKKGREHGFPTANIANTERVPIGIYAARVSLEGKRYDGAVYVGTPAPELLEVHILEFEGDIYGRMIEVEIIKKIRDDFFETDREKLKVMISNDIKEIRRCLQE